MASLIMSTLNMMGERMVSRSENNLMKGEQITLDLAPYSSGLYLIKLETSQGNYFQKVSLR